MADDFPVDKVSGMRDRNAGEKDKGRIYHIVILSYPADGRVREKACPDGISVEIIVFVAVSALKISLNLGKAVMLPSVHQIPWGNKILISHKGIHAALFNQVLKNLKVPRLSPIMKDISVVVVIFIQAYS